MEPHPEQAIGSIPVVESLMHAQAFNYSVYSSAIHPAPRDLHNTPATAQTWQGSISIAPQQTHICPPPSHQIISCTTTYPACEGNGWNKYEHTMHSEHALALPSAPYDYGYLTNQAQYYDPAVSGLSGTLG